MVTPLHIKKSMAMNFLSIMDLIGCGVFAISGAMLAYQQKMDGVGVIILASVTAIGGGTLRDLLLDTPVFWLNQPSYFYAIFVASMVSIAWLNKFRTMPERALEIADALGLALFVVMGTQKALDLGASNLTAIIMGTITGCFGGMIRDVLANQVPMILKKELYAVCCFAGGIVLVLASQHLTPMISWALAFTIVLLLRLAAIKMKWTIPVFKYDELGYSKRNTERIEDNK